MFMPKARVRLYFNKSLWSALEPAGRTLYLDYFLPVLHSGPSYHFSFKEISLTGEKSVFIEKIQTIRGLRLEGLSLRAFARRFLKREGPGQWTAGEGAFGKRPPVPPWSKLRSPSVTEAYCYVRLVPQDFASLAFGNFLPASWRLGSTRDPSNNI